MSKKLRVAMSPLTGTIFAGTILKNGYQWGANKQDVTGDACASVAMRAINLGGELIVTENGIPKWEISAKEIKEEDQEKSKKEENEREKEM